MFKKERELIGMAKKVSQKEALELMMKNPELLNPMVYILFAIDAGVDEILPHSKYCALMKKKAIQTNNKKLLKMVMEAEGSL
ncbi:hypothetical protein [Lederbergia citri]|uniref:Uncharacterized protein n=1 Tax=Lederbergia citri TaxID=2833580 RepID=A0A942TAP9_9BACI|nr:hypothetical protein [Lederbergia citri]MBS4194351.1 hypothetical protein [Lederbergia citri]